MLLHKLTSSTTTNTNTLTLPITFENINSGGLTDDISCNVRTSAIVRLGNLITNATSDFQSGTVAAKVLKYGGGS